MDFGRDSEAMGMEVRVETGGEDMDDVSGLDIEIDRLIILLTGDADQAVVQSAIFSLLGFGPEAFVQLTATAIEVLGRSCQARHGAIAILIAGWGSLVNPSARAAMRPSRDGRACHRDRPGCRTDAQSLIWWFLVSVPCALAASVNEAVVDR
jgi:hypothetical protein